MLLLGLGILISGNPSTEGILIRLLPGMVQPMLMGMQPLTLSTGAAENNNDAGNEAD